MSTIYSYYRSSIYMDGWMDRERWSGAGSACPGQGRAAELRGEDDKKTYKALIVSKIG